MNIVIRPSKIVIKKITILFLTLALVGTIHGVFNALNPEIESVTIPIKNLPKNWENKTIIQLSDVHLGYIYKLNFLENVVKAVNAQDPYIIFITGDLFDGMGVNPDEFTPILDKFSAEKGVYFVTGNHESYAGLDKILTALKKTKMNILNDQIINIDGMQIIGLSFPEFGTTKNLSTIIQPGINFDQNKPSILLYHTPTNINSGNGNSHNNAYFKPDTDFTYSKNLGINLQLSGHSHAGQFFPFTLLTHYIYNGFEYGLNTDGDFSIYTASGTGSWGPPIRTGTESEIVKINLIKK